MLFGQKGKKPLVSKGGVYLALTFLAFLSLQTVIIDPLSFIREASHGAFRGNDNVVVLQAEMLSSPISPGTESMLSFMIVDVRSRKYVNMCDILAFGNDFSIDIIEMDSSHYFSVETFGIEDLGLSISSNGFVKYSKDMFPASVHKSLRGEKLVVIDSEILSEGPLPNCNKNSHFSIKYAFPREGQYVCLLHIKYRDETHHLQVPLLVGLGGQNQGEIEYQIPTNTSPVVLIDKEIVKSQHNLYQHLVPSSYVSLVVNNGTRGNETSVITVGKCSLLSFYLDGNNDSAESNIVFEELFAIGRDRTDLLRVFEFSSSRGIRDNISSINERRTKYIELSEYECDGEELNKILLSDEIKSISKQFGKVLHAIVTLPYAGLYSFIGKGVVGDKIYYSVFNNQVVHMREDRV